MNPGGAGRVPNIRRDAGRGDAVLTTRDGIGLSVTSYDGGDRPPLLLIAGTGYGGATWRPDTIEAFRADRRVIVFDHRGTGRSGSSDGPYTTRGFAEDAATIMEALGVAPAFVLGHSMGGRVGQWLALDRPDLVAGLVLAASGAGRAGAAQDGQVGVPYHTALGLIRDGYHAHLRTQITRTFFTKEFGARHAGEVDWLVDAFWASRPTIAQYLKHVLARQGHSTADRLGAITARTLIVVGDQDTHVGGTGSHWDQSRILAEGISGATFQAIEGLAHGLFWQWPERTIRPIREWMNQVVR